MHFEKVKDNNKQNYIEKNELNLLSCILKANITNHVHVRELVILGFYLHNCTMKVFLLFCLL